VWESEAFLRDDCGLTHDRWHTESVIAAFLSLDAADLIFLGGAFVIAAVLTLLANPLTSWVNKLAGSDKRRTPGKNP